MTEAITDLQTLLASMQPVMREDNYVFAVMRPETDFLPEEIQPFGMVREQEGVTLVIPETQADGTLFDPISAPMKLITLQVHSSLQAVGLTAAVADVLGQANISCNVIAAYYHDHLLIPTESAQQAMAYLMAFSQQSASAQSPD